MNISRIEAIEKEIIKRDLACLVVSDTTDLLYLTGLSVSAGTLVVYPGNSVFFLDGRYFEGAKKNSLVEVLPIEKIKVAEWIAKQSNNTRIGFDSIKTTYAAFTSLQEQLQKNCASQFELIPCKIPISPLRSVKDQSEIELLKRAAELGTEGFQWIIDNLEVGVSEKELAKGLEVFWLNHGADGLGFDPIIAFGSNTAQPHYHPQESRKLQANEAVLIDLGVRLNHYHSDMTRTVFFGEAPEEFRNIHNIVLESQRLAAEYCRPGVTLNDADKVARDYIKSQGYGDQFIHSIGHGIGLEIHEPPFAKHQGDQPLELRPGSSVTIEPGIYIEEKWGVRIEDTIVITETGNESLSLPSKELQCIPVKLSSKI